MGQKDRLQRIEIFEQTGHKFGIVGPGVTHNQGLERGSFKQAGNNLHALPMHPGDKTVLYSVADQPERGNLAFTPPKPPANAHVQFSPFQGAIDITYLIQERSDLGELLKTARGKQKTGEINILEQSFLQGDVGHRTLIARTSRKYTFLESALDKTGSREGAFHKSNPVKNCSGKDAILEIDPFDRALGDNPVFKKIALESQIFHCAIGVQNILETKIFFGKKPHKTFAQGDSFGFFPGIFRQGGGGHIPATGAVQKSLDVH
jgi:hypothetical protein